MRPARSGIRGDRFHAWARTITRGHDALLTCNDARSCLFGLDADFADDAAPFLALRPPEFADGGGRSRAVRKPSEALNARVHLRNFQEFRRLAIHALDDVLRRSRRRG